MEVKGKMSCKIEIDSSEAIGGLLEDFGIKPYGQYSVEEIDGIKGIYTYRDVSVHGSPEWEYTLIREGERAIQIYEALRMLEDCYEDFLKEENNKSQGSSKTKKHK
jgi:hypothetical protein